MKLGIASFNQRTRRVWQRIGFQPIERFIKIGGRQEFIIMTRIKTGRVDGRPQRQDI